jgi:Ca2+-binding RTX toxin-like protein
MTQLTGNFQGSAEADTFSGSINSTPPGQTVDSSGAVSVSAVKQVIIDTFAGNDTITAETRLFVLQQDANAVGMTNADINTGTGADNVGILSNTSVPFESSNNTALQNSFIETDADNDVITVKADGAASKSTNTGIRLATLSAGTGDDTIQVNSFSNGGTAEARITSSDIGIDQSTLLGGEGQDVISISSENPSQSEGGGDDTTSTGTKGSSSIQGGVGSDRITVRAKAETGPAISNPGSATAKGISDGTVLEGGEGDDIIDLSAQSSAGGVSFIPPDGFNTTGGTAQSYGAIDASIFGDAGKDSIKITSSAQSTRNSPDSLSYGVFNSTIDGGNDDDLIEIKAVGSPTAKEATNSTHHGAVGSTIYGGLGSDTIDISAVQADNVKASAGALNSTIDAGDGGDSVKLRGIKFDIQDSLILGGGGDDAFDTGMGAGTVLGGSGIDLLKLDFFDADTMSIEQQGADGLKITGTADKTDAAANWSQSIFEVESYEVAGTVYNAADVVNLLG